MTTQATAIYGLNLSPILLAFQQIPSKPDLFAAVVPSAFATEGESNIVGYIDREKAAVQINKRKTVSKEGKSNKALIPQFNYYAYVLLFSLHYYFSYPLSTRSSQNIVS
jgi:hypothetical protein